MRSCVRDSSRIKRQRLLEEALRAIIYYLSIGGDYVQRGVVSRVLILCLRH